MDRDRTVDELEKLIRKEWAAWDRVIDGLPEGDRLLSINAGGWSVKDVIAHLSWHERETINVILTRRFEGSPLWARTTDARNEEIYAQNRARGLVEILNENRRTRTDLIQSLPRLTNDDLIHATRFPPMPPELTPLQIFDDNTWMHYRAHRLLIEKWLTRRHAEERSSA